MDLDLKMRGIATILLKHSVNFLCCENAGVEALGGSCSRQQL